MRVVINLKSGLLTKHFRVYRARSGRYLYPNYPLKFTEDSFVIHKLEYY